MKGDKTVDERVKDFFSVFGTSQLKKKHLIISPEDSMQTIFYLNEGFVREYGISNEGLETSIHIFTPGSYFPMISVVPDIKNRYYYEALSDVVVSKAPKDVVVAFLKDNPDILFDLTRRILIGIDKLTMRIEQFAYADAYQKVISILLYLIQHFKDEANPEEIDGIFTHREIGSLAGISRETTSRALEKLQKMNIIGYNKKYIVIKNIDLLKEELNKRTK